MNPEPTNNLEEDSSVEEFDINFEFDAPRFIDFSKPELDSEKTETELWFESAGNYPPSPFSLNWSWNFDDKPDKYNGFLYHNKAAKHVSNTTKSFLRKNSTLTRPTASLLARQNKPLDIYSVQLLTRCQRSLVKFDDKISSILSSKPQTQDTKRQKLETGFLRKVSRLDHVPFVHKIPRKGSKITVPKEPNLKTAERAAKHRFKANSAPEQIEKFSSTLNKTVQESSTTSLSKRNIPRPQDFKAFHLRTSIRARERSSSAKIPPTDDPTHSVTSKSIKGRKVKESRSSKTNGQVHESNIRPLEAKMMQVSCKCSEAINIKHENNFPMEFEAPKVINSQDDPFIESLSKLCLTSDTDPVQRKIS